MVSADPCSEESAQLEAELVELDCPAALSELKVFLSESAPVIEKLQKDKAASLLERLDSGHDLIINCFTKYRYEKKLNDSFKTLLVSYLNFMGPVVYRGKGSSWSGHAQKELDQAYLDLLEVIDPVIEVTYNKSLNSDACKAGAG